MAMRIAEKCVDITSRLGIPYAFKGSFKKANRSRIDSFTGIGDEKALKILAKVRSEFGVPVVTDIHREEDAAMAAEYVDILQIPAFLCRQTDLLVAAARTGKTVNIKKGQFLAPEAMQFAAQKVAPEMQKFGYPVVVDCTHSLQRPNQTSGVTGGQPELIETISKAAVAVGADGLFMETHMNPAEAKSDGANMLPLDLLEGLLTKLVRIRAAL